MPIIKWSPFMDPFHELEQHMRTPALRNDMNFIPAIDMYETKDAIVVETALPGIDPTNVSVEVEGSTLMISGETTNEREVDEKNYYRKEVRSGSFKRALRLPTGVDAEKIKAEFESGMLKITAPKQSQEEAKKIEVNVKRT